jgi:hypothetical protein
MRTRDRMQLTALKEEIALAEKQGDHRQVAVYRAKAEKLEEQLRLERQCRLYEENPDVFIKDWQRAWRDENYAEVSNLRHGLYGQKLGYIRLRFLSAYTNARWKSAYKCLIRWEDSNREYD